MGEASCRIYMARMTLRLDGFYCVRRFAALPGAHFMRFVDAFQLYVCRHVIEVGVLYAFISYLSRSGTSRSLN